MAANDDAPLDQAKKAGESVSQAGVATRKDPVASTIAEPPASDFDELFAGPGTQVLEEATKSAAAAGLAAAAALGWPEIPGFELLTMLGRGGFGIVFKAREMALDRLVALKMLRGGFFVDESLKVRFQREAQALAHLDHPNVIPILGNGLHRGMP